jgi:hypothetical protein
VRQAPFPSAQPSDIIAALTTKTWKLERRCRATADDQHEDSLIAQEQQPVCTKEVAAKLVDLFGSNLREIDICLGDTLDPQTGIIRDFDSMKGLVCSFCCLLTLFFFFC